MYISHLTVIALSAIDHTLQMSRIDLLGHAYIYMYIYMYKPTCYIAYVCIHVLSIMYVYVSSIVKIIFCLLFANAVHKCLCYISVKKTNIGLIKTDTLTRVREASCSTQLYG